MRYFLISYYQKSNGQMDEVMAVSKNLKRRDLQTSNVILDFKDQKVMLASMGDQQIPKDWERIVAYYYQHYAHTIKRLFEENGHSITKSTINGDTTGVV